MQTTTETLIEDLIERTRQNLNQAEELANRPEKELNHKPGRESWSALECIEHLNLYGDFYLPEIENGIQAAKSPAEDTFRSGWLGNYFANMMLPREKLNKMKTFKDKNPNGSKLSKCSLTRFIDQQQQLLNLLQSARSVSMTRTKTAVSISKFIRLRLGDTLRVVIYHNQRHLLQAQKVLQSIGKPEVTVAGNI